MIPFELKEIFKTIKRITYILQFKSIETLVTFTGHGREISVCSTNSLCRSRITIIAIYLYFISRITFNGFSSSLVRIGDLSRCTSIRLVQKKRQGSKLKISICHNYILYANDFFINQTVKLKINLLNRYPSRGVQHWTPIDAKGRIKNISWVTQ